MMDDEGNIGIAAPERPPEPSSEAEEEKTYKKMIEDRAKMLKLRSETKVIDRLTRQGILQRLKELEKVGKEVRKVNGVNTEVDEGKRKAKEKKIEEEMEREMARYNNLMPSNDFDLQQGLDKMVSGVISAEEAEKKHRENVPQIALRFFDETQESKKGWKQIKGWEDDAKRDEVLRLLKERLGYTDPNNKAQDNQARQAMYSIAGSGKTAAEALELLNEEDYNHYKNWDETIKEKYAREVGRPQSGEPTPQWVTQNTIDEDARLMDPPDRETAIKFLYLHDQLGIENSLWISRAVLNSEFRDSLRDVFDSTMPKNLFDLAWNMGYNFPEYGINGLYPVLQMQVDIVDGKPKGRYVVNQGNLVRWFRDQQWRWYEVFDTQTVTDYFSKIELHKGPMYSVNLMTMLFDKERYFSDETGYLWEGLYNQVLLEPWMMLFLRTYAVELDTVDDDIGKLKDKYKELFHLSKLTMSLGGLGKSMVERLSTLPVDYTGIDSDTKVGDAMTKMLLAYYDMADFEALKQDLGEDSRFFTKQGWIEAAKKVYKSTAERTHQFHPDTFFGNHQDEFKKAFGEDGKIKDQKAFMKFINIYESAHSPATLIKTYDQIVKDCVAESLVSNDANPNAEDANRFGEGVLDNLSLNYAWLIAHSLTFPSGATARGNFPAVSGHKAETRYFYADAYRQKYMGFGGAGAYATTYMFPQTSLPFFEGIVLENKFDEYSYYDSKNGKMVTKKRYWTPMEMMRKMNQESNAYEARRMMLRKQLKAVPESASEEEKRRIAEENMPIMDQIAAIDEDARNFQKANAQSFSFNENAMREWAKNLHGRGADLYDQLMKGTETAFDKFTVYDGVFRGPSFKQDEWQDALQTKYITPLRYLFDANGGTQLNMKQRFPELKGYDKDGKPIWEFREMYVGERLLGHQVLDIPTFRMQVHDLKNADWIEMRAQGYKKKGKYVVRPDGRFMINYDRVQDNKPMVYKQWLLTKIAADLHHHISRHTTNPQYSLEHYENIIKAIEELPGNLIGNQYDLRGNFVTTPFFSHEQIAWLRKVSGSNTKWRTEFIKALFMGDPHKKGGGIGESTNLIIAAVFKGY